MVFGDLWNHWIKNPVAVVDGQEFLEDKVFRSSGDSLDFVLEESATEFFDVLISISAEIIKHADVSIVVQFKKFANLAARLLVAEDVVCDHASEHELLSVAVSCTLKEDECVFDVLRSQHAAIFCDTHVREVLFQRNDLVLSDVLEHHVSSSAVLYCANCKQHVVDRVCVADRDRIFSDAIESFDDAISAVVVDDAIEIDAADRREEVFEF